MSLAISTVARSRARSPMLRILVAACLAVSALLAVAAPASAAGLWSLQNPTSSNLDAVACPAPGTCWAVGDKGTIVVTHDGGAEWTTQSSGTATNLNSVSCVSATTCVAVGDKSGTGVIVATTNGGMSWSAQSSGTANNLDRVSCADAGRCWAVGQNGAIVATSNGGATWAPQSSGTSNELKGVACPSTTACVAVGSKGTVRATTDGGVTWSAQTSGTTVNLTQAACATTTTCWATGASGVIVATTNGGTTWSAQTSTTTNALNAITCASATRCFAAGASGTILATTNGGASWSAQSSGRTTVLNGVACSDTSHCFSVGATGWIIATTDGGATWTPQTTGTTAPLNAVACISANACWAVGGTGTIVATTNGGLRWVVQPSGVTKNLNDVTCVGAGTCYAVGDVQGAYAVALKTTDGGATWSSQTSNAIKKLNGVACTGASTCWAVGDAGGIATTADGGVTWSLQTSGVTKHLTDIACPAAGTCYAVGQTNGAGTMAFILKTVNGGTTWTPQTSNTVNALNAVSCADASDCVAVGAAGTIVETGDGGVTWSARTSGTAVNLNDVACPDLLSCWVVGNANGPGTNGTVLATTDAGASWFPQASNTTSQLQAVAIMSAAKGWAVGSAGAIDVYENDTTPPAAPSIDSSPGSAGADRAPSWSFTGEPGATLECRLDRGATVISAWAACDDAASYDLTGQPDGAYTFSVRATDQAGNIGPAATSDYTLDTVAPATPTLTSHPLAADNDPNAAWGFTSEAGTAVRCRLMRGLTVISDWTVCTSPNAYDLFGEADGTYTFSAYATDAAGNTSAQLSSSYVYDATVPAAPVITSSPASPGPDATVDWGFTGEAGATFSCKVDGPAGYTTGWAACTSPDIHDLTAPGDGTYTFSVNATDAAGNTSTTATATYVLDRTAPGAATITSAPQSPGHDPAASWSFSGAAGTVSFECRLDRDGAQVDGWAPCTSPHAPTLSADGSYVFSVRAVDGANNRSAPAMSAYELDRSAPGAPTITDHPLADDDDATPTWTATTAAGNALQCRLERGLTVIADWTICTGPAAYDLTGEADGPYTFSVRAIDPAGNIGAATTSSYNLDRVAPGAPVLTGPAVSPAVDAHPQWTFTGDAGAAFDCRLVRDGTVVTDWTTCDTPQAPDLTNAPDGAYSLSVRAIDLAGNTSAPSTSSYELDRHGPAAPSIDVAPPATGSDTHPAWEVSTNEVGATIECRVSRDGTLLGGWAACPSPHTEDLSSLGDASYEITFRVKDAAGNIGAEAASDYMLDTGADPAPSILSHPASPGHATTLVWSFSGQGGSRSECRLDRNGSLLFDWGPCSGTKTYDVAAESDGTFTFSVRAIDSAGNVSAPATSDYELDRVAPAAPVITSTPASPGTSSTPTWAFTAEAGANTECRLDRGAVVFADWAPCTSSRSYDLTHAPDGSYTISVRATDTAANASTARTSTYTVDRTGPEAPTIASGPAAVSNVTRPAWTFGGEAGAALSCRLVREAIVVSDWAPCSESKEYDVSAQPDGTYTFSVRATDGVGNVGAAATAVYVLDTSGSAPPHLDAIPRTPSADRAPSWAFSGVPGDTYECRLDRGPTRVADWARCASPQRYDLTNAPDAGYTFMVRAIDQAGNAGSVAAAAYDLDTTPPGPVKLLKTPADSDRDRSPTWTFSGEGGPLECRVARGAVTLADWATCTSPKVLDLRGQADGSYVLAVREADPAGNRSTPVSAKYKLDTEAPTAPAIAPPAPRKDDEHRVGFSFQTDDDDATFECKLAIGATVVSDWATCTSPKVYDLGAKADGDYQFSVRATDAAGNTSDLGTRQYTFDSQSAPAPAAPAAAAPAAAPPAADRPEPTKAEDPAPTRDAPAPKKRDKTAAPPAPAPERAKAPATPVKAPATHREPERHGAKKAAAAVAHAAGAAVKAVGKTVGKAAVVVAKNADKSVFPGSLIFIVFGFLGVQGRIDRSDPKLSLAPLTADQEVGFGPPPSLR